MPSDELRDAFTKLDWVKRDIDELNGSIVTYAASRPYAVIREIDNKTGEEATKVRSVGPISDDINRLATHVIELLWSPLDYLATALADRNGVKQHVYFPTADNRHRFIDAREQKKRRHQFGDKAARLFDRLQPYGGGKGQFIHALRSLNNPNKHRGLVAIGSIPAGLQINHLKVTSTGPFYIPGPKPTQSLEDGITLFVGVPEQEIEHDITVVVNVAFRDVAIVRGKPIVPILTELRDGVTQVLETFDSAIFLAS